MNRKPVLGLGLCFGNAVGFHRIHRPSRLFHGPCKIPSTATNIQESALFGYKALYPGSLLTKGPLPSQPVKLIGPTGRFIVGMRYVIRKAIVAFHVFGQRPRVGKTQATVLALSNVKNFTTSAKVLYLQKGIKLGALTKWAGPELFQNLLGIELCKNRPKNP